METASMTYDHVVVAAHKAKHRASLLFEGSKGRRWLAWFGVFLALEGLGEVTLTFYPRHFGSPEWEFGTIAAACSALPLLGVGMAATLAAGLGMRSRWLTRTVAVALAAWALALLLLSVLFTLDVPIAARAAHGAAALGAKKAIATTYLTGMGFATAFGLAAVGAFRTVRSRR
jgi:hypothetical protein